MSSWVGPWVPFSKLSRQKAIETCEILIEQRDRQFRRAEAAEARLAAVLAVVNEGHTPPDLDDEHAGHTNCLPCEVLAAARGESDQ